jgi:beta-glucosidase/6-phospho-beta-glucosidase/beta-galactosidase
MLLIIFIRAFINELVNKSITPVITLYHWDLPQGLQDMGGFMNQSFVGWFTDYADLCFGSFGDKVR